MFKKLFARQPHECPKIIVFDKTTRRNRTIVNTLTDEKGIRWYMFADEPEHGGWVCEKDTEAAIDGF